MTSSGYSSFGENYSSFLDFTHNYERTSGIFVPCVSYARQIRLGGIRHVTVTFLVSKRFWVLNRELPTTYVLVDK